jgi:hypothetical protein
MGIGGSIALLVIGAILAFAVKDTDLGGWLDVNVVGWVLILAGLAMLVITLWVWNSRRRRIVAPPATAATTDRYITPNGEQVVERRYTQTDRPY